MSGGRSVQSRSAAHKSWAMTDDRTRRTRNGRQAFMERFENQVDPDRKLPAPERVRRAESARKAYFLDLAAKSAKVRRENAKRRVSEPF